MANPRESKASPCLEPPRKFQLLSFAYSLTILIPTLAVAIRRLHDIGKSGWIYFYLYGIPIIIYFILLFALIGMLGPDAILMGGDIDPEQLDISSSILVVGFLFLIDLLYLIVGAIWILILLVRKGDSGENHYGPDPQ